MATRKERIELRLNLFLKSRKSEKTKEYSKTIIDFLESRVDAKTQGWVRSKDLKDALVPSIIPGGATFFNLLADMVSFRLIEKEEIIPTQKRSGKHPVYYRTRYDEWDFMTQPEAAKTARNYYHISKDYRRKLDNAIKRLQKHHPEIPEEQWEDILKLNPGFLGPPFKQKKD